MKAKSTEAEKRVFQIAGSDLVKIMDAESQKHKHGLVAACSTCKYCDDGVCTNKESVMFGWWINPKSSSISGCNKFERRQTNGD